MKINRIVSMYKTYYDCVRVSEWGWGCTLSKLCIEEKSKGPDKPAAAAGGTP